MNENKFTPRAEESLRLAQEAAQDMGHDYVGCEHLLLGLLRDLAEQKGATPAQISLSWMLCKKPYIVPIPGSRKVERMRENAGAAEVQLSAAEVAQIDHILDTIPMSAVFGGTKVINK